MSKQYLRGLTIGLVVFVGHSGLHVLVDVVFVWGLVIVLTLFADTLPKRRGAAGPLEQVTR